MGKKDELLTPNELLEGKVEPLTLADIAHRNEVVHQLITKNPMVRVKYQKMMRRAKGLMGVLKKKGSAKDYAKAYAELAELEADIWAESPLAKNYRDQAEAYRNLSEEDMQ